MPFEPVTCPAVNGIGAGKDDASDKLVEPPTHTEVLLPPHLIQLFLQVNSADEHDCETFGQFQNRVDLSRLEVSSGLK